MVTQLKRYRNLLISTFGRSLKTFHHIKDTTEYLKKMENLTIPENTTLVTMDVTSSTRTFPVMTELPHAEKYGNNEQFKNLRQNV
jgi:hypothetical protein